MKIRELFETEIPLRFNECKFSYMIKCEKLIANSDQLIDVVPQTQWEKLAARIDPRLSLAWLLRHSVVEYDIIPTEAECGDVKWFEKLETNLIAGAKELVKNTLWTIDIKRSEGKLVCHGIPSAKVDYHDIKLSLSEKNTTLTGLNKVIGASCNNLVISNINFVKGNVLSLLKIPKTCEAQFEISQPWAKIVDKHLIGDRNIIACQEELFKNGLDEYAKL